MLSITAFSPGPMPPPSGTHPAFVTVLQSYVTSDIFPRATLLGGDTSTVLSQTRGPTVLSSIPSVWETASNTQVSKDPSSIKRGCWQWQKAAEPGLSGIRV